MSNCDSKLKSLLSPSRSGTFFAPFRSRSANPDGFDSKMNLWVGAIEEWAVSNKKLTFSLTDIHQSFISDASIRPDKECIRLVFSEMKRRSRLVPLSTLKTSNCWSSSASLPLLDNLIDPKGWLSWGVKNLVYMPASWAISTIVKGQDQTYSDLTDMSITDTMRFVSLKSLNELSQNLLMELVRISKAEKQYSFEWQHLLELITPIMNTIIDATDGKELLEMLDILIDYLAINNHVATQVDNDTKLVKVASQDDSSEDSVIITQKDIAMARLLRAKELLTADADKYHSQARRAKQEAIESYQKNELAKAKSQLRSHKRLTACADQKEAQLNNVETMLEQLESTDSNMMILQAYKDGADALRIANMNLSIDDMYDVTAEALQLIVQDREVENIRREITGQDDSIAESLQPNILQLKEPHKEEEKSFIDNQKPASESSQLYPDLKFRLDSLPEVPHENKNTVRDREVEDVGRKITEQCKISPVLT